jgi:chromosome segregation ATPase
MSEKGHGCGSCGFEGCCPVDECAYKDLIRQGEAAEADLQRLRENMARDIEMAVANRHTVLLSRAENAESENQRLREEHERLEKEVHDTTLAWASAADDRDVYSSKLNAAESELQRLRGAQPSIQQVIEEMRAVGDGRYVNAPLDVRDVISPALPDPGSPEREK